MIRVLVVDDSPVLREFLVHILESDPALQVVGTASNGEEAINAVHALQPDLITMDINMPKMDGFVATRRIMETAPRPIVIVTSNWDPREVATSFRAVEAGALAVVPRPPGLEHPEYAGLAQELIQTVKLMAEVKVIRRWARRPQTATPLRPGEDVSLGRAVSANHRNRHRQIRLVAVGASTGGPLALQTLLAGLPSHFPAPVAIVQHMPTGFIPGFVEWLAQATGQPMHVATNGETLLPGHVYVAPDGSQMKVQLGGKVGLVQDGEAQSLCPSISYLFRSVAEVYGPQAAGVLLTGMGKDGAAELKLMRDKGAITFVQDKESAVVYGMPGAALLLDAATHVLSPERIAAGLADLATKRVHNVSHS